MCATTQNETDLDQMQFFVGGEWTSPLGTETHLALEASTGEVLGRAALGAPEDIDLAVQAARRALEEGSWARSTAEERAEVLFRFAEILEVHSASTSRLVSQENGMPIAQSLGFNGVAPVHLLRMYAEMIKRYPLDETRVAENCSTLIRREPVGVVGAIVPWNYPQALAMCKIAPALAAGCTVVLKPSPETALDSYVMGHAANEAGIPPGVLNIVLGDRVTGALLVKHPEVDKISFTGSTAAGRLIGAECGRLVRRVTLELGGKSAAVVLDDADLDRFAARLGEMSFEQQSDVRDPVPNTRSTFALRGSGRRRGDFCGGIERRKRA